jgi:hypothetical protein
MNSVVSSTSLVDLISNKEVMEKSNVLFTLSTLKKSESFHKALQSLGFKRKQERKQGLLSYQLPSKGNEVIKIGFDEEYNIGIFITKWRKSDEIPNKLEEPLRFHSDIAQLWIKPLILSDMLDKLKENFRGLKVTWFSGISDPKYRRAIRRPEVKRTLQYSGDDGLETFDEMKREYGIMPKILEISIPNIGGYRIDYRGIVSVRKGSLKPIYNTILGAIEENQPWLHSFDKSKIMSVQSKLSDYSLNIRKVFPWKVKLGRSLFINELTSFEHRISYEEELFSTMNRYVRKDEDGSVSTYYSLYTDETNYNSFGVEFSGGDNCFSIYPHKYKSLPSMFNLINALHDNLEPSIKAA